MHSEAKAYLTRVKAGVSQTRDLTRTSEWIVENTSHPKDRTIPWSFDGHEMQLGIVNCPANHAVIRKCSQVGISEVSVRVTLALLDVNTNSTAIYTLPTASFAQRFAKGRIDPVIEGSKLKDRVNADTDGSSLKQIGGSFLYIAGSFGQNSAISVPADILVQDEVDFSNQTALTTFVSRLGHAFGKGEEYGIQREFSTPTVEGYGVSLSFDDSTQARYHIHCDHCSDWVAPDFLQDVVIPGYDGTVRMFEKSDLQNPNYLIKQAYLNCPSCHNPISQANLADPSKRQWIHAYPDRDKYGFDIAPFDVPSLNPIHSTLLAMSKFESRADWVNFRLGQPYEDAETSFLADVIDANTTLSQVIPVEFAGTGFVMGVDVGKTSHLLIGKRNGLYLDLVHAEQIRQDDDDYFVKRVLQLLKWFRVSKAVIDANPDYSSVLKIIGRALYGQVYACYYVRAVRTPLSNKDVKDDESVIHVDRTSCFDDLAKQANSGRIRYARMGEMATVKAHLKALKRIKSQNSKGETTAHWIKTGDDHYGHALQYLALADQMCDYKGKAAVIPALPMAGKARFGDGQTQQKRLTEEL